MRILIIGNLYDNHIGRFVSNLKKERPDFDLSLYYFGNEGALIPEYCSSINHLVEVKRHFPVWIYRVPYIKKLAKLLDHKKGIEELFVKGERYDFINVQYVSVYSAFEYRFYHKLAAKVLLTPWGSDVYRVKRIFTPFLRKVYTSADFISSAPGRFIDDVVCKYGVNRSKLVNVDIGSDTIDYICEHKESVSKEEAKEKLGFDNDYVIVCGYNGSPAQNHKQMIDALCGIEDILPQKYKLVFPMTYAGNEEYIVEIKDLLGARQLNSAVYEEFLPVEELFLLKRCADIFIHVQSTDAHSSAVREFLILGTKVLNGEWLRYKELETFGIPYYLVDKVENLQSALKECICSPGIELPPGLADKLQGYGWKHQIRLWADFFANNS